MITTNRSHIEMELSVVTSPAVEAEKLLFLTRVDVIVQVTNRPEATRLVLLF